MNAVLDELREIGTASPEAIEAARGDLSEYDNMKTSEIASLLMELYP
jgi:hypothetical protein